jgi:hypothetical protein
LAVDGQPGSQFLETVDSESVRFLFAKIVVDECYRDLRQLGGRDSVNYPFRENAFLEKDRRSKEQSLQKTRLVSSFNPPLGWSSRALLKQIGIESSVNVVLMGWIVISLECSNQSCYPGGKNNQIVGIGSHHIGVCRPRRHKDCCSGADVFGSVGIAEG